MEQPSFGHESFWYESDKNSYTFNGNSVDERMISSKIKR